MSSCRALVNFHRSWGEADDDQLDALAKRELEKLRKGIVSLYSGGQSLRNIASFYDVSHEYVRQILQENGIPLRPSKNITPQIGDKRESAGYIDIYLGKDNPHANTSGWAKEHRVIMEDHLGRKLELWEVVHHKNRNKKDNRIENLEVMASHDHPTCNNCPYYSFYLEKGGKGLTKF